MFSCCEVPGLQPKPRKYPESSGASSLLVGGAELELVFEDELELGVELAAALELLRELVACEDEIATDDTAIEEPCEEDAREEDDSDTDDSDTDDGGTDDGDTDASDDDERDEDGSDEDERDDDWAEDDCGPVD